MCARSQAQRREVDPSVAHRRKPVITARDGVRETEEPVEEPVLLAHHAPHHAVESVERGDVRDELQPLPRLARPGHRASHHERGGIEALLRGALDVRGLGSIVELFVGRGVSADHVVALARRHAMEPVEVVDPALDGGEARAVRRNRRGRRRLALRILGAVLEAREIAAASIFEEVHRVLGDERVREESPQVARGVEEGAAVGPTEEEPERLLCGRDAATWSGESGKDTQARDRLAEGEHRGKTDADDPGGGWLAIAQAAQRGRAVGFGGNAEGEASRYGCMRLEDAGLRFGHGFRCSTRSQEWRPDERVLAARPGRGSSFHAGRELRSGGGVLMREFAMVLVLAVAIAACGNNDRATGGGSGAVPAGGDGAPVPDAGPAPAPPVPDAGPAPAPAPNPAPNPAPAPAPGDADGGPGDSSDGGVATGGADGGTASQPPAYSVTDLGNAIPTFIDPHGTVAGSVCDDTACAGATFTTSGGWTPAPVPPGARWVVVTGIDAAGRLAMNAEFPGTMRSTYPLPYRSSPLELVPILATDAHVLTHGSHLNAVNPMGHLVGTFYENAFGPNETTGSYFYDGARPGLLQAQTMNRSEALAINSHDQVVGWMQVGPEQHAFLWDHGTMRDLGTVSGASTMATAINDSGVVTGWGATSPTSGVSIAFRWDGQMHALGCPSGTIHCETFAINARGDIVGEALVSITDGDVAFLHRDGVFYRLADLVQDAPGWQFDIARAINDAGQIVGTGRLDGKGHAFLLTPR